MRPRQPGRRFTNEESHGLESVGYFKEATRISFGLASSRGTLSVMRTVTDWRELCRFDDLLEARAVVTSIAAMEFDVRLSAAGDPARESDDAGRPPYVVEVIHNDLPDLAEVLSEIIYEQREFDRHLARCGVERHGRRMMIVILLTGAADIFVLLGVLEL